MKKVRFAVVGIRSIGNAYVVNAIQKLPEAELITICDNDPEILEKALISIEEVKGTLPSLGSIHIEGPYLSPCLTLCISSICLSLSYSL